MREGVSSPAVSIAPASSPASSPADSDGNRGSNLPGGHPVVGFESSRGGHPWPPRPAPRIRCVLGAVAPCCDRGLVNDPRASASNRRAPASTSPRWQSGVELIRRAPGRGFLVRPGAPASKTSTPSLTPSRRKEGLHPLARFGIFHVSSAVAMFRGDPVANSGPHALGTAEARAGVEFALSISTSILAKRMSEAGPTGGVCAPF